MREFALALKAANDVVAKQSAVLYDIHTRTQNETFATLIVSGMSQGVVYIDKDRIIRFVNASAEPFLAVSAVGKPYQQALRMLQAQGVGDYSLFESAFAGKTQVLPDNFEITGQRGTFTIGGTITPISVGSVCGPIVFIFSDISEQVARIKEEQAFFSAAAHELRTPLTVIRLTVSLLRKQFDTMGRDKILEHLKRTDETTENLAKLVNDFLNISRIDQGRLTVSHESFDMVSLVDEVIAETAPLVRERNLYIHHETAGSEFRTVIGDKAKAKEVVLNLISNGIKYTTQGGLTVTHQASESLLVTNVTDTGTGIPLEYQSLLFKRFQQVGEAHKQSSTKSTGLGLYISKKLAQLMHGDVMLEKSEPGKGSTFSFTLPLG